MPVFDTSTTIKRKMKEYTKEDLKNFAYDLDMYGISKLKKDELSDAIADKLLDPQTMFYRMSIFDDKAIELFEKAIGKLYEYTKDEFYAACIFDGMDYAFMRENVLFVPQDVAEAWKTVRTEDFERYRKRASWVWKCLHWTEEMYGYTPIEKFLDVCNIKKGFRIKRDELIRIFDRFPMDQLWTIRIDDIFLSLIYAEDKDELYSLRAMQADKDFYIPAVSEVEELFDTLALLSGKPYQDMLAFMKKRLHMPDSGAKDILHELWNKVAADDDPHDTMQWFWDQLVLDDESLVNEVMQLYTSLTNGTRMRVNRGHTPNEMVKRMKFGSRNVPVITAGSSEAAAMLAEVAPQIRQMGFEVDLDSNADRISVMDVPNGLNGEMRVSEKKIYPNDPCPCGSGKKYKKCCGRRI